MTPKILVKTGDKVGMPGWFNVGDLEVYDVTEINGIPYAVLTRCEPYWLVPVADMAKCSAGWMVVYDDVRILK